MADRDHAYIAPDGWWFLLPVLAGLVAAAALGLYPLLVVLAALLLLLGALFHDPARDVPGHPMGVLSPVDGRVTGVDRLASGLLDERPVWRVRIRVDNLGAYTARSPMEGRVMELGERSLSASARSAGVRRGLWVRGDDGSDVVVVLHAVPLLGRPRALVRYGERIGQGQRCAWLRVARDVDVYLPHSARPEVRTGDRVLAGRTALAELVAP